MAIKSGIQKAKVTSANLPASTIHTVGPVTISIANPGVFTSVHHDLENNSRVYITTTGDLPSGVSINTEYFVVNKTDNTFNLANIDPRTKPVLEPWDFVHTNGNQTGVHTLVRIGHYARYRIISEDRNRFSHWSPVYFVEDPNATFSG